MILLSTPCFFLFQNTAFLLSHSDSRRRCQRSAQGEGGAAQEQCQLLFFSVLFVFSSSAFQIMGQVNFLYNGRFRQCGELYTTTQFYKVTGQPYYYYVVTRNYNGVNVFMESKLKSFLYLFLPSIKFKQHIYTWATFIEPNEKK